MTDLTVRLVLAADGRALRTEIVGASRQVEQFTEKLEQGGVRVERSSAQAEQAVRRIGQSAVVAGRQVETAMTAAASPAVLRLRQNVGQIGFQIGDFITQVQAGGDAFTAFAQQGGQLAGALAGGLAGLAVQIAAVGAQMLFAGESTDTAAQSERAFTDAAEAVNAVLTTREERARRAAAATLDLATRTAQARIESLRAAQADALVRRGNVARNLGILERDLAEASPRNRRSVQSDIEEARRELAQLEGLLRIQGGLLADAERQVAEIERTGTRNLISGGAGGGRRSDDFDPFKRLREAGRQFEQELRTPLERYNDEVARLNNLLSGGFITQDTWYRGLARASEELGKAERAAAGAAGGVGGLEGAFEGLAREIAGTGKETAKMLADALLGIQRLEGGVLGLIARFASGVIERLIYEQITAPLAQAAGMLLQSGLSSLLGFFGGPNPSAHSIPGPPIIPVTATPLHTGGIVGREGGAPRAVPELLFSAAPRLHSGGYIRPGEVPAILKRGEGVFTPEQMAALGGGDTTVIINDMRSASAPPVEVRDRRGPDGRRIVETFVRDAVNRGLADGSFDRAMQMSYGISRAGMR